MSPSFSTHRRWRATLFLLLSLAVPSSVPAQSVHVELLSKTPLGLTPAGGSWGPWSKAISVDGRFVVFQSAGPDLVEGQQDRNGTFDIFLMDREAGATTLVSHRVGHPRTAANARSFNAVLSGNGRFVAFTSTATDLVAGAVAPATSADLFLFDWLDGSMRRVPRLPIASTTPAWTYPVAVSDTGWVLFYSESENFVENDTPYSGDAFLFDPATGQVRLVSHVPGEPRRRPAFGLSKPVAMSRDGRWTLYDSSAGDLDASLPSPAYPNHVYLYDRDSDTSRLISRNDEGELANWGAEAVALTPDGAVALFRSASSNLSAVPDVNEDVDAFVFERATGEVHSLSVGVPFQDGRSPAATWPVGMSDDGRRVLLRREIGPPFEPWPWRDLPYDHAYVVDRKAGTVRLATHFNGEPGESLGGVEVLAISGDGSSVLYSSPVSPVREVPDENRGLDVFLYDIATDRSRLVSGIDGSDRVPTGATAYAQISADSSLVLLHSHAIDLITGVPDHNGNGDMFTHDLRTGRIEICGRATGKVEGTAHAYQSGVALSPDGSGVGINGFGLVPGRAGGDEFLSEPFFVDRMRPTAAALAPRSGASFGVTRIEKLAAGTALLSSSAVRFGDAVVDTNYGSDVFVAALDGAGVPHLLSRSAAEAGRTANGESWPRAITPSGRHVLFDSKATDLVPGVVDTPQTSDVFVFDREAETVELVSAAAGDANVASGGVESMAISDDGRWVLAKASSPAMVPGGHQSDSHFSNVYLVDRETATVLLVSHAADDPLQGGEGHSYPVALSPDGRWVLYASRAPNLVAGQLDTGGHGHAYVYDRESGHSRLVSHRPGFPLAPADGNAEAVAITDDGRHVLFHSDAPGLTPELDLNGKYDVFVHDMHTARRQLASIRTYEYGIATGNNHSFGVALSQDGSRVLFSSRVTDLLPGVRDTNWGEDAFVFDAVLGRIILLSASIRSPGSTANAASHGLKMTRDGSGVLFSSEASDLVDAIDVNGRQDVFFAEIDFAPVFASGFEGAASLPAAASASIQPE